MVHIDRVFLVASPSDDVGEARAAAASLRPARLLTRVRVCQVDPAKAAAAKEDKKRKEVEDGEKAWLVRTDLKRANQSALRAHAALPQAKLAAAPGGNAEADAKDEGFIKAYLETIMGNLQLSITNVHIRFEGELPAAGSASGAARFAAGITLQELSAITTDASGAEAFEAKARAARCAAARGR